ncbi:MAG TPA: hypothetical protein VG826_21415 [Pirellulales bacterium]|nr:hypothetical protein [Pirellulales bacterium]
MRALSLTETVEHCTPMFHPEQQELLCGRKTLSFGRELPALIVRLARVMREVGYGDADELAVGVALEKAATVALAAGSARARVSWAVSPTAVTAVVEEEQSEVEPAAAGEPQLRDRLEGSSGGGFATIRGCMSWVCFPHRNCIAMRRNRTA